MNDKEYLEIKPSPRVDKVLRFLLPIVVMSLCFSACVLPGGITVKGGSDAGQKSDFEEWEGATSVKGFKNPLLWRFLQLLNDLDNLENLWKK